MERRKFTQEFKLEAVRLIKERGVSYVQALKWTPSVGPPERFS
jgi:transposase-like protein